MPDADASMDFMSLPPTLDQAIRLIQGRSGCSTVDELADAVAAQGWNVDRADLVDRIHQLFKIAEAASQPKSLPESKPKPNRSNRRRERKTPQRSNAKLDYCPKCHAFVEMTKESGVTIVAKHDSKKGEACTQGGREFGSTAPARPDALDHRVPGSYGTGSRH